MRFTAALIALPLAVLGQANLYTQVKGNLTQANTDIIAENTTLNQVPNNQSPTNAQVLALVNGANKIDLDLNRTIAAATASSTFTLAQSNDGFAYLNGTVFPSTDSLLKNFIRHEVGIRAGNYQALTRTNLQKLRTRTQSTSNILIARSQGPAVTNGPALRDRFLASFDAAIARFQ